MENNQKLELIWYGKTNQNDIESRILIEDKNKSNTSMDSNTDNILIHGDNLLALRALEGKYSRKIKCIYIDPPYNTGSAFENYDDNVTHSIWLSLMKPRLELLYKLLADDGYIFVQIDDNEQAYLTVLMDEIFGRKNRVNTICINMNSLSGLKMTHAISGKRFPSQKEYILLYKKGTSFAPLTISKVPKSSWDPEYNLIIPQLQKNQFEELCEMDDDFANALLSKMELLTLAEYSKREHIEITDDFKKENSYRIFGTKSNKSLATQMHDKTFNQTIVCYTNTDGNKRFFRSDYNRDTKVPRVELVQAKANSEVYLSDNWTDISNVGGIAQEGGVVFPNGKKPERLLQRVIECCTKEGDYVLDSFLGSGTTCAVAHKLNRKWIGIEVYNQAYTHCIPRLNSIIDGTDLSGITESVNWKGGGGYRFYELAPTLIKEDSHGQPIINPEYNADMLAASIALHEGYTYEPSSECFWKQSIGQENSYLFVTTLHVNQELINSISSQMNNDEKLLVVCRSYDQSIDFGNSITIKKIPQSLLNKCEFNHDDYSLNIINPPIYEEEEI